MRSIPPASRRSLLTCGIVWAIIVSGETYSEAKTFATVSVNGRPATITSQHAGVADWIIRLAAPADGRYLAQATDRAGNAERMPHQVMPIPDGSR